MTLQSRSTVLSTLFSQRKLAEAEALGRRALAAVAEASDREVVLAKAELEHNLAVIVGRRSNLKDAEAFARSSLTARKALLGEDHYETLISATNLASFLLEEAKYGEAEEIARATLEATSRRYGEESPEVADALEALSRIVRAAGRMTEAETLARRALAMFIRTIGPDFPATATAYNNLSLVFMTQGRYAEAEELLRRALEVRRKTQGEDHFETVSVRDNLAVALDELHRPAEAEPLHRAALEYRLKKFGRDDAATASAYNNLGLCLVDQGKLDEAESALREHLEILKRVLPPGHPTLARGYSNLMRVYQYRKQWDVAVGLIREAAQVRGAALGDAHPLTARTYDILASILAQGGAHEEALAVWEKAAASESVSGAFGRKGLRGAVEAARSPSVALAAALARAGRPIEAWDRWEAGLARGLLAEVAGRAARPLTPEEQREEAELAALSQANEEAIGRLALLRTPTPADAKRLETLRAEGHDLLRRSLELEQRFEARYGALAGQPASLEVARASLAEGEAFVGWSDVEPYHYACLLRREGEPEWIPLSGSGPDGAWTPEDSNTTGRLRRALATREASTGEVQAATNAMAKLRISPLLPRLKGVRRLVVVNSPALSGLPVEPLLAASGPKEEAIAVSYAPSASMFVYLKGLPPRADGEPKLLAVGDPAYSVPAEITYAPNLALNGPKHAAVDGDAEARSREADRVLRGGPAPPARLPGTRREVEAIAGLFPPGRATTLLGEHARESALQGLARSGELKDFRFIHFAGHGRSDPGRAFASALLLAPDPDQPGEASADSDGIVTAEQIARGWDLDADLVVLSACESALGLDAAGEGQLGFAQPLFAKGARSLVLSLWKVDDDATALLMARFYRNLLGDPAAKLAPMPKAEALADAKAWLREAADDEIGRAVAALPRGPIVTLDIAPASNAGRRYADPRYWAAFVLIGSPD
jgi:CHAT domain-containing protein/tetratricopeptide (TPR) repeat protein